MGEETAAPARTEAGGKVGSEAVALLQELIRIDTVNPPGNEEHAQLLLAETLTEAGFESELLAAEPGRPNLVARLRGDIAGPTLCLLGHADTVPADTSEWSFDPWAGDVVDGEVRGRGAQDMKDQVAAEVAAAAALGRDGWRPRKGELLVVTTADEEMGAAAGAQWLCREHPEKVRSDYVLNEGGGISFELDGRRFYTLCVGEKGPCRFVMRARGVAGHASLPGVGDNALLKLAPALERLREQPPLEPTPEGVAFVAALTGREIDVQEPDALEAAVERLREAAPEVTAYLVEPMLRVTLVPTVASASVKENVIPSRAEVLVDCRVPPGMGRTEALEHAQAVLGEAAEGLELEFTDTVVGNRSSADSPLATAIEEWLGEADPPATLLPIVMAGFSDSHWFREAFDSAVVYGFCPQREMALPEAAPLIHGADERAAVADIDLAARFYLDIVRDVLG
ncbi:MAG: M20/M25/M40 family metallo-hydrolase [Actinobacteria bacterium]|nr:MAG: M20/M25/M40 family metallo-hydrolase [Actinomycetota bacterium]